MRTYNLRLTTDKDVDWDKLFEGSSSRIVVKEGDGVETKVHYHGVFDLKDETLANAIRKRLQRLGYSGNKDYRFVLEQSLETSLRYLCKGEGVGKHPVVILNDYPHEIARNVILEHNKYWEIQKDISKWKVDKKIKIKNLKETILQLIKKENINSINKIQTAESISLFIINYCIKNKESIPSDFNLVSYIEYIQGQLSPQTARLMARLKTERVLKKLEFNADAVRSTYFIDMGLRERG